MPRFFKPVATVCYYRCVYKIPKKTNIWQSVSGSQEPMVCWWLRETARKTMSKHTKKNRWSSTPLEILSEWYWANLTGVFPTTPTWQHHLAIAGVFVDSGAGSSTDTDDDAASSGGGGNQTTGSSDQLVVQGKTHYLSVEYTQFSL